MALRVLLALLSTGAATGWFTENRVACERTLQCNGIFCAFTCLPGTVVVDDWAAGALAYQRQLQLDQLFVKFEMPGTHNSAISLAYGFGIEEDGIEALLGTNLYNGDDVGEGVSQYLSVTDQLRIGLRHIEIDIWWGEYVGHKADVVVCHSPVPLYPVWDIEEAARRKNVSLGWDVLKLSCIKTFRYFPEILQEVKDWMDQNPDELVMLYLDTKWPPTPSQAAKAGSDILSVFGSQVFTPGEGDPRNFTLRQLLSMGKRVIVEDHQDGWLHPENASQVVFTPDLWAAHQFGASDLVQYPVCSIQGDTEWYGRKMVRALDGTIIEPATRCGVNIVSGNYQNPDEMKLFVWSWDQLEPRITNGSGCVAMLPSGRWAALPCTELHRSACQGANDTIWTAGTSLSPWAGPKASCPTGYVPAAPTNGYSNARLRDAVLAEVVWLNTPLAFD
eukprot:TRINITY_DN306_c0_g1_i2.p1 TRINITY_DN306_c0_g1~~TRINITY_DN306_c0_g1_i2.p1  ORF type:complete len:446 (+),score=145.15 TRINITY_DN306_c0_g1_i2:527-1864(+)